MPVLTNADGGLLILSGVFKHRGCRGIEFSKVIFDNGPDYARFDLAILMTQQIADRTYLLPGDVRMFSRVLVRQVSCCLGND